VQREEPTDAENFPAGHSVQLVEKSRTEKYAAGQSLQDSLYNLDMPWSPNSPARQMYTHFSTLSAWTERVYLPVGQEEQTEAAPLENVPGTHAEHVELPATETDPGWQGSH
jgi:hypothetical protein